MPGLDCRPSRGTATEVPRATRLVCAPDGLAQLPTYLADQRTFTASGSEVGSTKIEIRSFASNACDARDVHVLAAAPAIRQVTVVLAVPSSTVKS